MIATAIERTCVELHLAEGTVPEPEPRPLAAYRDVEAYVLVGDPGSGKTTAFQMESGVLGDEALFITARDFIAHDPPGGEFRGRTLFIDGLDEVRAGQMDARSPLEAIRKQLLRLNRPRFRISCREADWLGENDQRALSYVAPENRIAVLRLQPLERDNITEILCGSLGVTDPESFVDNANEAGLDGLLANPQSLVLLAKAVSRGAAWPRDRRELFHRASRELAKESNQEHRIAIAGTLSTESVVECAGRLCALLLISDKEGYSLDGNPPEGAYVSQNPCPSEFEDLERLKAAVSSNLFSTVPNRERCFRPVHRQIGEFLAARHLAGLINGGVSRRRVLSLMTGADGVAVTAMRGLCAWLAAHCSEVRAELIKANPVDLVVYGDPSAYSAEEKKDILHAILTQSHKSLGTAILNVRRFAPLVTAGTQEALREVLSSKDRHSHHEARVSFVLLLLSLTAVDAPPGLSELILAIVRDSSRSSRVRLHAVRALIRCKRASANGSNELKELLEGFRSGGISRSNCDLCGTLLYELYPRRVGPSQVWDYLAYSGGADTHGPYYEFWRHGLVELTTEADVEVLLDTLACSVIRRRPAIKAFGLWKTPLEILQGGLDLRGDQVGVDRIQSWLGVGVSAVERNPGDSSKSLSAIRIWLEQRPAIQKHILLDGLEALYDAESIRHAAYRNRQHLLGSRLPADFGPWCLQQAVKIADSNPTVAEHLFLEAYQHEVPLQLLREQAGQHPHMAAVLTRLRGSPTRARFDEPPHQQQRVYDGEQEQQRRIEIVLAHKDRLLQNRAHPELLFQLARMYFGESPDASIGFRGEHAIAQALGDPTAIGAAMYGLRHCIDREDLPSVSEILRLWKTRDEHWLSLALMASLEECDKSTPERLLDLDEQRLRAFVACLHCWEPGFLVVGNSELPWYQRLLDHRPEMVSEVAVQCAGAALRSHGMISLRLWETVEMQRGGPASNRIVVKLLKSLPAKCKGWQVKQMAVLLWKGLRLGLRSDLLDLTRERLGRASLDVGQRVHWLGVGLICAPEDYREPLASAIEGKERSVRHFSQFCVQGYDCHSPEPNAWQLTFENLDPLTLALIVRLVGRFFSRLSPLGFMYVSDETRISGFLDRVINALGSNPCETASESLDALVEDPKLCSWRDQLSSARQTQRAVRRDAEFQHPTLRQACETLNGGPPASACDLAALTVDKIEQVAERVQTANPNEWRQYWSEDSNRNATEPKHEESCRDALLSALRPLLPVGVTAEPEGQHVNSNRADIVVCAESFQVPVEAKKNNSRDLWSGVEQQLIAKYTLDPASGGYGVYLVFWFGADSQRPHPDGVRPDSPQCLRELLMASLKEEQARKIHICVLDASRPTSTSAS